MSIARIFARHAEIRDADRIEGAATGSEKVSVLLLVGLLMLSIACCKSLLDESFD